MKIVYVNPFFTDEMGYIENCLPKAMAKRGHDVHIITSTGKVYFNEPMYKTTYEKFFGPAIVSPGLYNLSGGVKLHRLKFFGAQKSFFLLGLGKLLDEIKPDVVHLLDVVTPYTIQFFLSKSRYKYTVYTANHYHLSVLKVHAAWGNWFSFLKYKWLLFKILPGKIFSRFYERCYAPSPDTKYVAEKYMGVPPKKCFITPLGVDTDAFTPKNDRSEIDALKTKMGFDSSDFIVVYTGRFTLGKNPLVLAKAIDSLQKMGYSNIKGLFVGSGDQKNEILSCLACKVVDFVMHPELPQYYQLADVGVWPAQESTSMLDALATGIPIIVNDTVQAPERVEGNGLTYKLGDTEDMAAKILILYQNEKLRLAFGAEGRRKMNDAFSWDKIAKEREQDYLQDLKKL